ncbi:MAG: LolA family protein [Tissierella sp.]|uniref:LolA family protein n=1 Tax=Tissierella sp. TaxID=41274 RepID=UPI003F947610
MLKRIMIFILASSFLLTGCESPLVKTLLPEEIVKAAIDTNEKEEDYYIKSNMKIFENGELIEEMLTEEWRAKIDGEVKRRTEIVSEDEGRMISLINEKEIKVYQEDSNEVFTISNEMGEGSNLNKSVKEKTMNELDMAKRMYEIDNLGEETINGRETYHLKGEPMEESSLLGDYEAWIDKDNWVVVKSINKSGDIKVVTENIQVEFSPEIDDSFFSLDLPEDVKKIDMDEDISDTDEITIEEADKKLGGKLLYISDKKYKLEKATFSSYNSDLVPDEMVFHYSKDDSGTFFISVLEKQEEMEDDGVLEFEEREIRGNKANIMNDILKMITFYEDGLQYNLIMEDEEMTIDEGIDIIENMKKYKK